MEQYHQYTEALICRKKSVKLNNKSLDSQDLGDQYPILSKNKNNRVEENRSSKDKFSILLNHKDFLRIKSYGVIMNKIQNCINGEKEFLLTNLDLYKENDVFWRSVVVLTSLITQLKKLEINSKNISKE